MNLASRFSLLALIALFSLISPKFASAQSYYYSFAGYAQCATGSTAVTLPSGTVLGANTHCWYVYGPGNSNNWPSPTNPPPPVGATGGSGGGTGGGGTASGSGSASGGCFASSCNARVWIRCEEVTSEAVIGAISPTNTNWTYSVAVSSAQDGASTWAVQWDANSSSWIAEQIDSCTGGGIPP